MSGRHSERLNFARDPGVAGDALRGPAISAIESIVGLAIVLLVLFDIFRTILLPRPAHRAL